MWSIVVVSQAGQHGHPGLPPSPCRARTEFPMFPLEATAFRSHSSFCFQWPCATKGCRLWIRSVFGRHAAAGRGTRQKCQDGDDQNVQNEQSQEPWRSTSSFGSLGSSAWESRNGARRSDGRDGRDAGNSGLNPGGPQSDPKLRTTTTGSSGASLRIFSSWTGWTAHWCGGWTEILGTCLPTLVAICTEADCWSCCGSFQQGFPSKKSRCFCPLASWNEGWPAPQRHPSATSIQWFIVIRIKWCRWLQCFVFVKPASAIISMHLDGKMCFHDSRVQGSLRGLNMGMYNLSVGCWVACCLMLPDTCANAR